MSNYRMIHNRTHGKKDYLSLEKSFWRRIAGSMRRIETARTIHHGVSFQMTGKESEIHGL